MAKVWELLIKYLGVPILSKIGAEIVKWIGSIAAKRKAKKDLKTKREIADAIEKRDARELARKFDKL